MGTYRGDSGDEQRPQGRGPGGVGGLGSRRWKYPRHRRARARTRRGAGVLRRVRLDGGRDEAVGGAVVVVSAPGAGHVIGVGRARLQDARGYRQVGTELQVGPAEAVVVRHAGEQGAGQAAAHGLAQVVPGVAAAVEEAGLRTRPEL